MENQSNNNLYLVKGLTDKGKAIKIILILSGGGAKGAFQVGVWQALREYGILTKYGIIKIEIPHVIFGISAGALNGAMIAQGKEQELTAMWKKIAGHPEEVYTSDFFEFQGQKIKIKGKGIMNHFIPELTFLEKAGLIFKVRRKKLYKEIEARLRQFKAISDNTPLANKVRKYVSLDDFKCEAYHPGFVSIRDGAYYNAPHTDYMEDSELQKAILASATIPVAWNPVDQVTSKNFTVNSLVDGALRNVTPLGDAVKYIQNDSEECEYHFVVVSCHTGNTELMKKEPNILDIALRSTYDIAMNEVLQNDINSFTRINDLVRQANEKGVDLFHKGRKLKEYGITIIKPSRELGETYDFTRDTIHDSINHGYKVTKEGINKSNAA